MKTLRKKRGFIIWLVKHLEMGLFQNWIMRPTGWKQHSKGNLALLKRLNPYDVLSSSLAPTSLSQSGHWHHQVLQRHLSQAYWHVYPTKPEIFLKSRIGDLYSPPAARPPTSDFIKKYPRTWFFDAARLGLVLSGYSGRKIDPNKDGSLAPLTGPDQKAGLPNVCIFLFVFAAEEEDQDHSHSSEKRRENQRAAIVSHK